MNRKIWFGCFFFLVVFGLNVYFINTLKRSLDERERTPEHMNALSPSEVSFKRAENIWNYFKENVVDRKYIKHPPIQTQHRHPADSTLNNRTVVNDLSAYSFLIDPGSQGCAHESDQSWNSTSGTNRSRRNPITLLAIVSTRPENNEVRALIRFTWANSSLIYGLRAFFLTGLSDDHEVNRKLLLEHEAYRDIVQADFRDTKQNSTLKTLLGLKWASDNCRNASFLLKVDEHVVVNSFYLLSFLRRADRIQLNNTLMCQTSRDPVSIQGRRPFEFRPRICIGPAFLMSLDLVGMMYNSSFYRKLIPRESIYLSQLAMDLNSRIFNISDHYSNYKKLEFKIAKDVKSFFYSIKDSGQFHLVWDKIYASLKLVLYNRFVHSS